MRYRRSLIEGQSREAKWVQKVNPLSPECSLPLYPWDMPFPRAVARVEALDYTLTLAKKTETAA